MIKVRNLPNTDEAHAKYIKHKSVEEIKRILINMAWQFTRSRLRLYLDTLEAKIKTEARRVMGEVSDGDR